MTVTVELTADLAAEVHAEADRVSSTPADLIARLVKEGVERRRRVDRLIEETVSENAELYRRLA